MRFVLPLSRYYYYYYYYFQLYRWSEKHTRSAYRGHRLNVNGFVFERSRDCVSIFIVMTLYEVY